MMCRASLSQNFGMEREREHGSEEEEAMQDPGTILALKNYGFLTYYKTQCMRKQVLLLEHIIRMWDMNDQVFHVGPHVLKMKLEEIYFLARLSKRGETISFSSHRGTEFSTEDYVDEYC